MCLVGGMEIDPYHQFWREFLLDIHYSDDTRQSCHVSSNYCTVQDYEIAVHSTLRVGEGINNRQAPGHLQLKKIVPLPAAHADRMRTLSPTKITLLHYPNMNEHRRHRPVSRREPPFCLLLHFLKRVSAPTKSVHGHGAVLHTFPD